MTRPQKLIALWIFLGFLAWIVIFLGFLTSQLTLTSDALSYYSHTKFFIESLKHGVFPLWDPYWYNGAPNDFFLHRIDAFNPFYLIILALNSVGLPYNFSYFTFLALYYWGGMIAFYLLAMRIYQDRMIAYAGYLILLFSALGTRLFDSYMMLVTIPLIWFFYFLVAFSQTPKKHLFLGMSLSVMILTGTYVPFYFIIIVSIFCIFFAAFYFRLLPQIFQAYAKFIRENKILVLLALLVIVFSLIPTIGFFIDSTQGHVVLPLRHGEGSSGSVLTVPREMDWGAVEDFLFSAFFSNLKQYTFAIVYLPFFSVIVFALGLIGRLRKQTAMLFLMGLFTLCSITSHGLPIYHFFYQHIFILKFFRNLHFFIWFFLIPLFVMLVLEHWKIFTDIGPKTSKQKWLFFAYLFFVHTAFFAWVWHGHEGILSTYIMIILSLIFWSLLLWCNLAFNHFSLALLTVIIVVQPFEVYHYLAVKSNIKIIPYDYEFLGGLSFKNTDPLPAKNKITPEKLYYASGSYNFVYSLIQPYPFAKYLQYNFILVDRLTPVAPKYFNVFALQHHFLAGDNTAFVFTTDPSNMKLSGNDLNPPVHVQNIEGPSNDFKILSFNANHVRLGIHVPYDKFLVYNDSYDPRWKAHINGKAVTIYETNGAFKGVWLTAGDNIVDFSYGNGWEYALHYLLLLAASVMLIAIIRFAYVSP